MECPAGSDCTDNVCELLHKSDAERSADFKPLNGKWPGMLIVCAGPERSGSTWLFNAVRLMLFAASQPTDSYWLNAVKKDKLAERGFGKAGSSHLLIKKLQHYVEGHKHWHAVASHEVPFTSLSDKAKTREQLEEIASLLNITGVDFDKLADDLNNLPSPKGSAPDPITKMWPGHAGGKGGGGGGGKLSDEDCAAIRRECKEFQAEYGYPTE
eukprot:jgi/Chlat1/2640/Chrsp178S00160